MKSQTRQIFYRLVNSINPDHTAPSEAVWSGFTLFAQTYPSEYLGSLFKVYLISGSSALDVEWVTGVLR